jgi:hypothetical protein
MSIRDRETEVQVAESLAVNMGQLYLTRAVPRCTLLGRYTLRLAASVLARA